MLETLRERLLSVQQDLTAGWVWPAAPRGWRGQRERGPRPAARPGRGGKQVTGGRGGVDWHREGGRGGDCADGSTAGAGLSPGVPSWVRGRAGKAAPGSRVPPCSRLGWADGGLESPAGPRAALGEPRCPGSSRGQGKERGRFRQSDRPRL